MYFNFIGGLSWGVGTITGATVIIGLLGLFISQTRNVPFVGSITEIVIEEINRGRQTIGDEFNLEKQSLDGSSFSVESNPQSFPESFPDLTDTE